MKNKIILTFCFLFLSFFMLACGVEEYTRIYINKDDNNLFKIYIDGALENTDTEAELNLKSDSKILLYYDLSGDGHVEIDFTTKSYEDIEENVYLSDTSSTSLDLKSGIYNMNLKIVGGEVRGELTIIPVDSKFNLFENNQNNELEVPVLEDITKEEKDDLWILSSKWNKITNADGYEISYSENNNTSDEFLDEKIIEVTDNFYDFTYDHDASLIIKVRAFKNFQNERKYSEWSDCKNVSLNDSKLEKLPDYTYSGEDVYVSLISDYLIENYKDIDVDGIIIPVVLPVSINYDEDNNFAYMGNFWIYYVDKFGNKLVCKQTKLYRGVFYFNEDLNNLQILNVNIKSDFEEDELLKLTNYDKKLLKSFDEVNDNELLSRKTEVFSKYVYENNLLVDAFKDIDGSEIYLTSVSNTLSEDDLKSGIEEVPYITDIEMKKTEEAEIYVIHCLEIADIDGYEFEIYEENVLSGEENSVTYMVEQNYIEYSSLYDSFLKFRVRAYKKNTTTGVCEYSDWSNSFTIQK